MENYYEFVELPCRDIKGKGPTSTYLLKVGEWLRALETVENNGPSIMGKKKVDEVLSFPIQGTLAANNIQMSGGEARPRQGPRARVLPRGPARVRVAAGPSRRGGSGPLLRQPRLRGGAAG